MVPSCKLNSRTVRSQTNPARWITPDWRMPLNDTDRRTPWMTKTNQTCHWIGQPFEKAYICLQRLQRFDCSTMPVQREKSTCSNVSVVPSWKASTLLDSSVKGLYIYCHHFTKQYSLCHLIPYRFKRDFISLRHWNRVVNCVTGYLPKVLGLAVTGWLPYSVARKKFV